MVEVLQRNWGWQSIDRFFQSLTAQLTDLHHFAWRAQGLNETVFSGHPALGRLMGNWTAGQCQDQDCVEALTQVRTGWEAGRGRCIDAACPP